MDGLYKLAYGLSTGRGPDDVTWPDDVIMVTSSFFFKMLLFRQFLSQLDDTLTPCSPIWYVSMVLTDSWSGSYDVTDDVITYNHCRNFGLNISETRPDSGMVPTESLYKLAYGLSIGLGPDDITWPDDVIMVTSSFFLKMLLLRQFLSEVRIGRYFNTMFPYMVCLYGPHG